MLYLASEKGQRTVKIGFTSNPAKRMNDYLTHSTVTQFIDWKEGTKEEEREWHATLEFLGFERVDPERERSEWFFLPAEISKKELLKDGFQCLEKFIDEKWNEFIKKIESL